MGHVKRGSVCTPYSVRNTSYVFIHQDTDLYEIKGFTAVKMSVLPESRKTEVVCYSETVITYLQVHRALLWKR
jgi:hypothetical protein